MSAPAIERRATGVGGVSARPRANGSRNATASRRARATEWIVELHDEMTALFTELDGGSIFREDRWSRNGGGGGVTRILVDGKTFAKAGVNRSAVDGILPLGASQRLGGRMPPTEQASFFATGLSLVVHPRNPHVPTVHLNVRYFELTDARGALRDAWFGGGTDLTPMYPSTNDARVFHCALRSACDKHHPTLYPRFKVQCDEYFQSAHRGGEARGVGGVFFDHVRPDEDDSRLSATELFDFGGALVRSLRDAYAPIVERRRGEA
jgi:coproporphyrinogen III oxidase